MGFHGCVDTSTVLCLLALLSLLVSHEAIVTHNFQRKCRVENLPYVQSLALVPNSLKLCAAVEFRIILAEDLAHGFYNYLPFLFISPDHLSAKFKGTT